MAIVGLFTQTGISKTIDAQNNEGFKILPYSFGVSRDAGVLNSARTSPNSGLWFTAPISARYVIDASTIKFSCTIPSGVSIVDEEIREIYVFAKDSNNNDFLLCLGQPSDVITYDPLGTVTLELQITLVDIDLTKNYVFTNTIAQELSEHAHDPNAHPEIPAALAKAGIYIPAGAYAFKYYGQNFDEFAEFDGTKAFGTIGSIVITSKQRGTENNAKVITFNGSKTLDEVITLFNNQNPNKMVTHNGTGAEVLTGTVTLAGGTYLVEDKDLVYRDVDGLYKPALAVEGSIKSKFVGTAFIADNMVKAGGFISRNTGISVGSDLYLSSTIPGKITSISTPIKVGTQVATDFVLMGTNGGGGGSGGGVGAEFDLIVTDEIGYKKVDSLQVAIDNAPNHGFILHNKMEELKSTVRTNGKTVNIVFRGHNTGLKRFAGQKEIQRINFNTVPDAGTWRIEFKDLYSGKIQNTNDLPYNASATLIQLELNMLNGHSGVTVTGDYVNGFELAFNDKISLPLVSFDDAGQNEIQRFDFDQVPDDGTIDFEYAGFSSINHAFNDSPAMLKALLEALPGIFSIDVRGSIEQRFYEIEFTNEDGLRNKQPLTVSNYNLNVGGSGGNGGVKIEINGVSTTPVVAKILKEGRFPANTLMTGLEPVEIEVTSVQHGIVVGPTKAIELDSPNCQVIGMGRFVGFDTAINMSSYNGTRIEMRFENIPLPIDGKNQIIGKDFNFAGSIGIEIDDFDAKAIHEVPVGIIDGSNDTFTLDYEPNTDEEIIFFRNGLSLPKAWFSVNGTSLVVTDARGIPTIAQLLEVWYTPDILIFSPNITYKNWFYEQQVGVQNKLEINTASQYTMGSDRLEVYRNGLLMNINPVGINFERYQEVSMNQIYISEHSQPSDVFSLINKDYRVLSKGNIVDKVGVTILDVPTYTLGTHSLRIFKNGALMTTLGSASIDSKYTELNVNQIQLAEACVATDIFTYEVCEFNGTRADFKVNAVTPTLTLPNSVGAGKFLVYRNGVLMFNSTTLGQANDRYQVATSLSLTLGEDAQTDEVFTVITIP